MSYVYNSTNTLRYVVMTYENRITTHDEYFTDKMRDYVTLEQNPKTLPKMLARNINAQQ